MLWRGWGMEGVVDGGGGACCGAVEGVVRLAVQARCARCGGVTLWLLFPPALAHFHPILRQIPCSDIRPSTAAAQAVGGRLGF